MPMIDAAIHDAVMALPPNEKLCDGLRLGPLRPAGSEDRYGVSKATE